jgi:hypothetical protein
MGPIWALSGQAHMGMHIWDPYGTHIGLIWASPYGYAHMGPIWALSGQAHMGMPILDPYGSHITTL